MAITFNPQVKLASNVSFREGEKAAVTTAPATTPTPPAAAEKQPIAPKKHGLANFATKVSYAWISTTGMTAGFFKGIFAGAAAGTAVAGADWLVSGLQKAFKPSESIVLTSTAKRLANMFKHPTSVLGAFGKVVAPIVAVAFLAGNLVTARLRVNEKESSMDHKLRTGHDASENNKLLKK